MNRAPVRRQMRFARPSLRRRLPCAGPAAASSRSRLTAGWPTPRRRPASSRQTTTSLQPRTDRPCCSGAAFLTASRRRTWPPGGVALRRRRRDWRRAVPHARGFQTVRGSPCCVRLARPDKRARDRYCPDSHADGPPPCASPNARQTYSVARSETCDSSSARHRTHLASVRGSGGDSERRPM